MRRRERNINRGRDLVRLWFFKSLFVVAKSFSFCSWRVADAFGHVTLWWKAGYRWWSFVTRWVSGHWGPCDIGDVGGTWKFPECRSSVLFVSFLVDEDAFELSMNRSDIMTNPLKCFWRWMLIEVIMRALTLLPVTCFLRIDVSREGWLHGWREHGVRVCDEWSRVRVSCCISRCEVKWGGIVNSFTINSKIGDHSCTKVASYKLLLYAWWRQGQVAARLTVNGVQKCDGLSRVR